MNRALNPKTLNQVRLIVLELENILDRMTTGNMVHQRNCAFGCVDALKHWSEEATKLPKKRRTGERG